MSAPTPEGFGNYDQLAAADWQVVQDARDRIRLLGKQTVENIIEIGRLLTEVKQHLAHGQWLPWLHAEFSWSETTARRFMDSHALFKSAQLEDLPRLLELPPSVVAEIAPRSTPEAARAEVLAKAEAGERVTHKDAKEIIERHKPQRHKRSLTKAIDRAMNLPAWGKKAREQHKVAQPEPPAVDMVPAKDALLISWLRGGDVRQVAYRLRCELGDDRLREIWAHLLPRLSPPDQVRAAQIGAPVVPQTNEPEAVTAGPPGELTVPTALATENTATTSPPLSSASPPHPGGAFRERGAPQRPTPSHNPLETQPDVLHARPPSALRAQRRSASPVGTASRLRRARVWRRRGAARAGVRAVRRGGADGLMPRTRR
jgi:hypothetical protein